MKYYTQTLKRKKKKIPLSFGLHLQTCLAPGNALYVQRGMAKRARSQPSAACPPAASAPEVHECQMGHAAIGHLFPLSYNPHPTV